MKLIKERRRAAVMTGHALCCSCKDCIDRRAVLIRERVPGLRNFFFTEEAMLNALRVRRQMISEGLLKEKLS